MQILARASTGYLVSTPSWVSMANWSNTPQCSAMCRSVMRKMPTESTSNVARALLQSTMTIEL